MFSITEYNAPEDPTRQITRRGIIRRELRTRDEAETEIKRQFACDNWKVTGYNEEHDYFWGRNTSTREGRRILRIEE